MIIINPEKKSEMPADVAAAIKDLNPDIKAKIEEVFKAYNDSERIKSSINELEKFFNTFENVCGKYYDLDSLTKKLKSICDENNITIEKSYNLNRHNIKIGNLINIKVNLESNPPYGDLLGDFSITYIGNNNEHKEKVVQICELLMNQL